MPSGFGFDSDSDSDYDYAGCAYGPIVDSGCGSGFEYLELEERSEADVGRTSLSLLEERRFLSLSSSLEPRDPKGDG
jgi:hypothetical protein